MIKFRCWWFDLLLAAVVVVSGLAVMADGTQPWVPGGVGLVLLLAGYVMVRRRLGPAMMGERYWIDWVGSAVIVLGVATASYGSSQFTLWLALACPVVWIAIGTLVPGLVCNVAMIALVSASAAAGAWRAGTLRDDWAGLLVGALFIVVFSVTMGLMVHAALRWGRERAQLVEELQSSRADLAESYQRLLADQTPVPVATECPLSSRELEVLGLVAEGYTNREIGNRLYVSPATIKTHMEHILAKLNATTRTQAVLIAHQDGFLAPDGQRTE